jgi:DNA transformation protein and related proteins
VAIKRMFGGGGVFLDGMMFGLVVDDVLFLKADDGNRFMFEAEGMGPFVYAAKGKSVTMSYWRAPERLYDESDDLLVFARGSLAAAHRGAKSKVKAKPRAPAAKSPSARET